MGLGYRIDKDTILRANVMLYDVDGEPIAYPVADLDLRIGEDAVRAMMAESWRLADGSRPTPLAPMPRGLMHAIYRKSCE